MSKEELEFVKKFRCYYYLVGVDDIKELEEDVKNEAFGDATKYYSIFLKILKTILPIKYGYEKLKDKQKRKIKSDLIKYFMESVDECIIFSQLFDENIYLQEINRLKTAYHFHLNLINNTSGINNGYLEFIKQLRKNKNNEMIKDVEEANIAIF